MEGGSITQSGLITTAASTTFKREGNLTNSGTLAGSGTLLLGSSYTLTNSGTISPGGAGAVGTLTLTGSLSSGSGGRLLMEANGTGATQQDLFSVSGAASLNGTLSLAGINSFNPADGQSYTLLSAGSAPTGSFSSIQVPSSLAGTGAVSGNSFVLTLSPACLGVCWDGGGGNTSWTDIHNWSGDALPNSTSVVYINTPVNISLNGDAGSIQGLNIVTGAGLTIGSGGSLTLGSGSNSSVAGTLTVNAGTLFANGTSLNVARLDLLAGTLSGAGSINVSDTFNVTGSNATLSGTGTLVTTGTSTVDLPGVAGTLRLTGGRTWHNQGSLTVAGNDHVRIGDTGGTNTLINDTAARLTLSSTVSPLQIVSGTAVVTNLGTIIFNSGTFGTAFLSTFTNNGLVQVDSGTFTVTASGTDTGLYKVGVRSRMIGCCIIGDRCCWGERS